MYKTGHSSKTLNEHEHGKLHQHIATIEKESGIHGLINALKELVIHTIQGRSDKDGKKKKTSIFSSFAPTYSSQPVGNKAIALDLVKNLEYDFGITPQRTNAIKEVLLIPGEQKRVLMRGLVERLLSKHALVNDRGNTFEAVMLILGNLGPDQQDLANELTQPLIQDDFKKPFTNYVGYHFRTADGSYNSLISPDVGKAGTNYVRTVTSLSPVNEQLPPAHIIFERLLKRPEGQFTPHKSGVNMLLFYLAIVITHDVFYSDRKDPRRNLTTGYLDLSVIYGFNRKDQETVRQMKDGLLRNDQWFDKRLVIQPPGVGVLMVLFSRNHNYIAKKLLEINENGRFSFGQKKRLKTLQDVDEEVFQTARLINTGCFANVVVKDYIRTILGISQNSDFFWDPLGTPAHPAYGNEVSIEFNVIYRWHAAIGKQDEEWLNTVMATVGPSLGHPPVVPKRSENLATENNKKEKADPVYQPHRRGDGDPQGTDQSLFDAVIPIFNTHFAHATEEELEKGLPLAGAHRDLKTGRFDDSDLAKLLRRGYTQVAGELGDGLSIPAALAPVEIAGIMQARSLGCCYFNEFRKFMNLVPMATFEDFSAKVEVQTALKELYGTPDKVELYVGILVERSKVVGLRLPYTVARAILSDAVNLLRNDRINTQEMTPVNLTNWGYQMIKGDPKQHGRIFPQLLNMHLANANPGGEPAFTDEETSNLFLIPEKTV